MININLLPWRIYQRKRQQRVKKIGGGIILAVCFLMVILYVHFSKAPLKAPLKLSKPVKQIKKPNRISLQTVSVHQMKLVGFIQQNTLASAFVRLPNGKVEVINLHDKIGREQAEVVSIVEQEVVCLLGKNYVSLL